MCTIIKVKRKIEENPAECLIIECKKKKLTLNEENSSHELIKQVLKYYGTAQTENDIPEKLNEINKKLKSKDELQEEYKSFLKINNHKKSLVDDLKKESKSQRYVLLNKKRGMNEVNDNENINVIDVISSDYFNEQNSDTDKPEISKKKDEILCNEKPLLIEKMDKAVKNEYIYDIYYSHSNQVHLDLLYSNNYTITSINDNELVFNDDDNDEEKYYNEEGDDDSNAEEHWKNDYPDEDDEYNEYGDDYDEYDHDLLNMMKKSCAIDNDYYDDEIRSENEDYDEYYKDDEKPIRSYNSYKKLIMKELAETESD